MIDNKKQWFLIILVGIVLIIALVLIIRIPYIPHDSLSITVVSSLLVIPGYMLRQVYHYYFPPNASDYELKKLKIQATIQSTRRGKV